MKYSLSSWFRPLLGCTGISKSAVSLTLRRLWDVLEFYETFEADFSPIPITDFLLGKVSPKVAVCSLYAVDEVIISSSAVLAGETLRYGDWSLLSVESRCY